MIIKFKLMLCAFFSQRKRTLELLIIVTSGSGGDQVVDIDTSFSDLLDNLDYGVSDIFIARKGSFSINLDLLFVGLNIVTPFIYIAITVTHTIIAILNIRSLFSINDLLQLSNTQTCY